ncbi:MAG: hypothetical protein Kow0022_04430 [Phycisphaerales bacterium]
MRIETPGPSLSGMTWPAPLQKADEQRSFAELFATEQRRKDAPGPDQARQAAEGLVAMTLVEPFLREARDSRDAEPPFGQTQAERQFGALIDARTAERIVKAWNLPLVDQLARQMREHLRNVETSRHEHSD